MKIGKICDAGDRLGSSAAGLAEAALPTASSRIDQVADQQVTGLVRHRRHQVQPALAWGDPLEARPWRRAPRRSSSPLRPQSLLSLRRREATTGRGCPLPGALSIAHPAAVVFRDLLDQGQAQAAAAGLGREEGLEDPVAGLGFHARAGVAPPRRSTRRALARAPQADRDAARPRRRPAARSRRRFTRARSTRRRSIRDEGQVLGAVELQPDRRRAQVAR